MRCTAALRGVRRPWYSSGDIALGQSAADCLPHYVAVPCGSWWWILCVTLPHCLGVVGSKSPWAHRRTALGQWAMDPLRHTAPVCFGAVGNGTLAVRCRTAWGSGQWYSYGDLALGQWAVDCLPHSAAVPWGNGQRNSCKAPIHCLGVVNDGSPVLHSHTAWGRGQWNLCVTPPHCQGALGSRSPSVHHRAALGQWAVEIVRQIATLHWCKGQCKSCCTLPHCSGTIGSGNFGVTLHWGSRQ